MASSDCENDNDFIVLWLMPSPVFIETRLSSSPSKQRLSSSSMMKKMCSCGYLQDMGNLFATMIVLPFLFEYKLGTYDHTRPVRR